MSAAFVDTNVLLYAVSARTEDARKRRRALDLIVADERAISVQVLAEFYHQATRDRPGGISHDHAMRFIEETRHFLVQDLTLDIFRAAVSISQRYRVSYWDGAILAAARAVGCEILYTEDLNDGQDYDGVRAVNPFTEPVGV